MWGLQGTKNTDITATQQKNIRKNKITPHGGLVFKATGWTEAGKGQVTCYEGQVYMLRAYRWNKLRIPAG